MNSWLRGLITGALLIAFALLAVGQDAVMSTLYDLLPDKFTSWIDDAPPTPELEDAFVDGPPELPAAASAEPADSIEAPQMMLPMIRKELVTTIHGQPDATLAPQPPAGVLEMVHYSAPLGQNVAYVTPVQPGPKRPAIVWIVGGFSWGIDQNAWTAAPRDNDQSGATFREAGIAQMYPALRGMNGNLGTPECFFGEIDDVIAAANFLAERADVDPQRVYLGGHSTGGVIALLSAASTTQFRAVFSLGPVGDVRQYGARGCLPSNVSETEALARAPIAHLQEIVTPTFVIEGAQGNAAALSEMKQRSGQAPITFMEIPNATHFTVIKPASEAIAAAILADNSSRATFPALTVDAVTSALNRPPSK